MVTEWCHMASVLLVNTGSGSDLLEDGTKSSESTLTLSSNIFCGVHLKAILHEVLMKLLHDLYSKIILLKLLPHLPEANELTHWGWVTHICVGKLTIIWSDNGLSPGRHQAII